MQKNTHLTEQDLLQVIEGQCPAELNGLAESHLTHCDSCRAKLESLAADADTWKQASSILTEEQIGETLAFSSKFSSNQNINNDDLQIRAETIGPLYNVESLLEPPRHPEMLGRLGHYEVEREIGRGGMGVVVKAFDTELNRAVAIKLMAPHLSFHGVARQRFAREAQSAAAILHPNVIAIHGVSTDSKTPWLVMPYIVGPSLEQIVRDRGALYEQDLVCFAMQIAAGLQAAHAQGLVHRDIKPANVLVESGMGRVVITDFGLARAECDASMTQTGWFAGTPNFMSPEQARGSDLDHRSDLFSLGSVMYFMATGKLPFRAEQTMAIFEQIRQHRPAPVRRSNPGISKTVSNLIERLLAKEPEDRVQSAGEVHQILEQYLAHLHHPDAKKAPVVKSPKRKSDSGGAQQGLAKWILAAAVAFAGLACWSIVSNWGDGAPVTGNDGRKSTAQVADSNSELTFDKVVKDFGIQDVNIVDQEMSELAAGVSQLEQQMNADAFSSNVPSAADPWMFDRGALDSQIQQMEILLQDFALPSVQTNDNQN